MNSTENSVSRSIYLSVEEIAVEKRLVVKSDVRIHVSPVVQEVAVVESLVDERLEIEHIEINRYVDAAPPIRQEGDTTIISLVEEVIERRIMLKQEIHVRKVSTIRMHDQIVELRADHLTVERNSRAAPAEPTTVQITSAVNPNHRTFKMNEETVVAVFDTVEHAVSAVADLKAAGVPESDISQHHSASGTGTSNSSADTRGKPGFWANLFGGQPEYERDTSVYDRTIASGGTVLTVKASEMHINHVLEILERHNPVDIDERAVGYTETSTADTTSLPMPGSSARDATGESVIQLSEESLVVGKRALNRGTTKVRRYVVETPVSEDVSLRNETVSVVRHAVADGTKVPAAAFTDQVIEMTETGEEVVVSKTARVVEEVVIKKDVSEHVETVKDTVRRDEVEITKQSGDTTNTAANSKTVPPVI